MKIKSYLTSLMAMLVISLSFMGCKEDEPDIPVSDPLTFELEVANVTAHGADLQITPSESDRTYYSEVYGAARFKGMSDEEIISAVTGDIKTSNLRSGAVKMAGKDMKLEADTEYMLIAVGYEDGAVASELAKKAFTTLKEKEEPENPDTDKVTFTLNAERITAHIAELTVSPSDPSASYLVEVYPAANVADKTDEELIEAFIEMHQDPSSLLMGDKRFKVDNLKEDTEYYFYALAINNVGPVSDLERLEFKTKKNDELSPLTFKLEVSNITFHGADLKAIPSDDIQTYFTGIAPATDFAGLSDEQILSKVLRQISDNELIYGPFSIDAEQLGLDMGTEYVFFAFGCEKGQATSDLAKTSFFTKKSENTGAPVITTKGSFDKHNLAFECLVHCTTHDATEAYVIPWPADVLDEVLLQYDMTLEEFFGPSVIASKAVPFDEENLRKMNSDEGEMIVGTHNNDDYEGMYLSFVFFVANDNGYVIHRCDVLHEGSDGDSPFEPGGPDDPDLPVTDPFITLRGYYDDGTIDGQDRGVTFWMQCTSVDASNVAFVMEENSVIDEYMAQGYTNETLMDAARKSGDASSMTSQWRQWMNTSGLSLPLTDTTHGKVWTFILDVMNQDGGRTIRRATAKMPDRYFEDPVLPKGDLYFTMVAGCGDDQGNFTDSQVWCLVHCVTWTAVEATLHFFDTAEVDRQLASGKTLEDLADNDPNGRTFAPQWLKMFNSDSALMLNLGERQPNSETTFVLDVRSREGNRIVRRADAYTTSAPINPVPEPEPEPERMAVSGLCAHAGVMMSNGHRVMVRPSHLSGIYPAVSLRPSVERNIEFR